MSRAAVRSCMLSFYFHPSYSGSAVQARSLGRHLLKRGVIPWIVSANLTRSPSRETVDGLRLHRLPVLNTRSNELQIASFWLSVTWFLLRNRRSIDIIHAHGTFQHAIASIVGRWLRKPTILKIAMAHSDIAFRGQGRITGRVNRALVSRFDCYIATSAEVYEECMEVGLDPARIRRIPNGVDTEMFRPSASPEARNQLRQVLKLPNCQIVCFVGVIDARKNVDGILRIWKTVQAAVGLGHLVLIGPQSRDERSVMGLFYQELMRFVEENGLSESVTFVGETNDVAAYLQCSDVFLFPSRREGMPNVLLEAMASGLACVASNIGGSMDMIRHDDNGCLFDVDDETGMAAAVERLLREPDRAAAMGAAARKSVLDHFSLSAIAQRYANLYAELASRTNRTALDLRTGGS